MTDYSELVKALGQEHPFRLGVQHKAFCKLCQAADAIEALVKKLDDLDTNGIHTCHDQCTRYICVERRGREKAEAENAKLREALGFYSNEGNYGPCRNKKAGTIYVPVVDDGGEIARTALKGDA